MKQALLSTTLLLMVMTAFTQSPTTVTPATNCNIFANFNNSNEGFSSPSIYSDGNDVNFNWSPGAGAEIESSGLTVRMASLISPVYIQSVAGSATIGFRYAAPVGAEYRVRILSTASSSPVEVLATTANGPVYMPLPGTSGTICLLLTDADLTVGRQVRFEFTFRANQPGNILFDDLSAAAAVVILPVVFEGFTARTNDDGTTKLLWNVSREVNVKGYYVESSTDGLNFTNAGYVSATGKTIYSIDIPGQPKQTMFYRVKNLDFDGNSKYTPVIRVYTTAQAGTRIQLYPMPANDVVTVQHNKALPNTVITLYSQAGKILQQVTAAPYTFQTQLHTANLQKGLYIVSFNNGQDKPESVKLVKQ